jgi:hypothetical protein
MPVRPCLPVLAVIILLVGACASPAAQTTAPTDAPATSTPTAAESDEPTPSAEPSESPEESSEAASGELDMSLPSNFGSTDLTAGFTPDPFSVDLVSGGPIDVTYLGSDCLGYATQASDYDVTYTAGNQSLLRFYFVADTADTTLIINAPDGSWHCNDDAPGTIDPVVDFASPEAGRYDVWIGSYASGTENSGTLFVTELESNGP